MKINSDFKDLLRLFNDANVRYLIVGGYAVMKYTEPRYTKDLDIWTDPEGDNADRVFEALRRFGAPLSGINPRDFTNPDVMYQLGIDPNRIDILTAVSGLTFGEAWQNRLEADFDGVRACLISRADLIANKRASGRPRDRLDLDSLESGPK